MTPTSNNSGLPAIPPNAALIRTALTLLVFMLVIGVVASAMKPTQFLAQLRPIGELETIVPMQFGDWRGEANDSLIQANPQAEELINTLYTQTLSRSYTDSRGRRIMLAIAYGDDQRDGLNMHYPEVCYPAQGFQSKGRHRLEIDTPFGPIKATRLIMVQGSRNEPITYWTMIGEHQAARGMDKKLTELRYSMDGIIIDGLLFRVSSINRNSEAGYQEHEDFINALIPALPSATRKRLAGL